MGQKIDDKRIKKRRKPRRQFEMDATHDTYTVIVHCNLYKHIIPVSIRSQALLLLYLLVDFIRILSLYVSRMRIRGAQSKWNEQNKKKITRQNQQQQQFRYREWHLNDFVHRFQSFCVCVCVCVSFSPPSIPVDKRMTFRFNLLWESNHAICLFYLFFLLFLCAFTPMSMYVRQLPNTLGKNWFLWNLYAAITYLHI